MNGDGSSDAEVASFLVSESGRGGLVASSGSLSTVVRFVIAVGKGVSSGEATGEVLMLILPLSLVV